MGILIWHLRKTTRIRGSQGIIAWSSIHLTVWMPSKIPSWVELIDKRAKNSACFSNITQMEIPRLKKRSFYLIVKWAKVIRSLIIIILRTASWGNLTRMVTIHPLLNSIRSMFYHDSNRLKASKDSNSKQNQGTSQLINLGIIVSCLLSRLIWYHRLEKYSKPRKASAPNFCQIKPISVRWACSGYLILITRTPTCFRISNLMKSHHCIVLMKPISQLKILFRTSLENSSLTFPAFRPQVESTSMRTICDHRDSAKSSL